jgi:hypothetical protein
MVHVLLAAVPHVRRLAGTQKLASRVVSFCVCQTAQGLQHSFVHDDVRRSTASIAATACGDNLVKVVTPVAMRLNNLE